MARIHSDLSRGWLKQLGAKLSSFERKLIAKNAIVTCGIAIVAGLLYRYEKLGVYPASVLATAGCLPLCHAVFRLSPDIMDMQADIYGRQRRNEEMVASICKYEVQLKGLRQRRDGDDSDRTDL